MIAANTIVSDQAKQALREAIDTADHIAVCGHASPDGDCLGSCMAIGTYAESLGKQVTYHVPDEPDNWLLFFDKIKAFQTTIKDHTAYDCIICIDTANVERTILKDFSMDAIDKKLFVIDHHLGNKFKNGTHLIDHTTASACELVTELLEERWFDLSTQNGLVANYLLMGILTDTGNFSRWQQPAKTLHVAAWLIEYGADKDFVVENLFRQESFAKIKEIGTMLSDIQHTASVVRTAVPVSELEAVGMEDWAIGHVLYTMQKINLDGIFMLIKIVDTPGDQPALKISFRSRKKHFNVCTIAQEFGWWWHRQAAWAKILLQWTDQADAMIARLLEQVNTMLDQQRLSATK